MSNTDRSHNFFLVFLRGCKVYSFLLSTYLDLNEKLVNRGKK